MKAIKQEPDYKEWFLGIQDILVNAISKIYDQKKEIEELRRIIAANPVLRVIKGGIDDAKRPGANL